MNDIYLSKINLNKYSMVCIDIYDVLLLRFAYSSEEALDEVGRRLGFEYAPWIFRQLRTKAEARARRGAEAEGRTVVTLQEIYGQLANTGIDIKSAIDLEVAMEKDLTYLNPNAYSFIKYCKKQRKPVALVSDTYFSKNQLKEILESAGLEFKYITHFLADIKRERTLYISEKGKPICWYPVVSETRRGIFPMEINCFSKEIGALASLRSLAMNSVPDDYRGGDDKLWFQAGCTTMGVAYTFFAEWVCVQAENSGIRKILCIMRDGELLEKFIRKSAEKRGLELDIFLFYISRRATNLLKYGEINDKIVTQFASDPKISLEDVFANFYLDISKTSFATHGEKPVKDCNENGLLLEVLKYLCEDSVVNEINIKVKEQRELLSEYILSLTGGKNAITVDLGIRGTAQWALDSLLKLENVKLKLKHLIMVGAKENIELLLNGTDIRAFTVYPEGHLRPPLDYKTFIYELCCSANVGVTLRYARESGFPTPVLEQIKIEESVARNKKIFQDGMLTFQYFWLAIGNSKMLARFSSENTWLYCLLQRFIQMPSSSEARLIGSLISDGGYGKSERTVIAPKISDASYNEMERFIRTRIPEKTGIWWLEGMVENTFPGYFANDYRKKYTLPQSKPWLDFLQKSMDNNRRVAVYGASISAYYLARLTWEQDLPIAYVIDKNAELYGTEICGIPVISPDDSVGKVDIYIIAPIIYEQEIRHNIEKLYEGLPHPEIFLRNEV